MTTRLRNERGQVIVLAAVMIPVFLLMTALVLDAGSWFAHKRQLQNRADAAALAAGDELAKRWPACITDPASQTAITAVAKHYGGALESGGVSVDPNAVNTEVVDNSKFDIAINSTSYNAGTDNSDGGGACFDHRANPAPEGESDISPAGGTWVDVKVKEKDTKSFAGAFGVDLLQNRARARVELLESSQGDQFVPLAVPEEEVVKARVRFINDCDGSVMKSVALKPLQQAYQTSSGMSLWGPDPSGTAASVAPGTVSLATPSTVPVPNTSPICNGNSERDYTPIRVEVRVAGRPDIDISDSVSCSTLQSTTSADCYSNISQLRVYQPVNGLFGDRPQIRNVTLSPSGANPCVTDPYYSRPATPAACTFDASVFMDWGSRPIPNATFTATIQVDNGATRNLVGPTPQGTWTATQVPISALGAGNVRVHWTYQLTSGSWGPGGLLGCTNKKPCSQSGNTAVHQVNLGDDPTGNTDPPSDVVGAVKLTSGPSITSSEVHSAETNTTVTPYVTIGIHSALQPGNWAVLRLRSGQNNYSVICDPVLGPAELRRLDGGVLLRLPGALRVERHVDELVLVEHVHEVVPGHQLVVLVLRHSTECELSAFAVGVRPARRRRQRVHGGRRHRACDRELQEPQRRSARTGLAGEVPVAQVPVQQRHHVQRRPELPVARRPTRDQAVRRAVGRVQERQDRGTGKSCRCCA